MDNMMADDNMKTRRRGCRGAPSKQRHREKWLARTSGAALAHRVGSPTVAPRKKTFYDGVGGKGAAAPVVAGQSSSQLVTGAASRRSYSVRGAAGAHRGDGSDGSSSRKTVGSEAGGNGAATRVAAGDSLSKSVAEAALDRWGPIGGVATVGGGTATSGGVVQRDGADDASASSLWGGGLQPAAVASLYQDAVGAKFGGCYDNGGQGASLSWWVRMNSVWLVALHVGYVCEDRWIGLGLAIGVAVVVALGVWLRGDAYEATMAAARRRQRATPLAPGEKRRHVSKKQRMMLCWSRVFEIMVARGMAGEEARLRLELRQTKADFEKLKVKCDEQERDIESTRVRVWRGLPDELPAEMARQQRQYESKLQEGREIITSLIHELAKAKDPELAEAKNPAWLQ